MHGKCGFGPLNHIAGRVKIVLGKKKTDKHTVWVSGEAAQHPICQSRSLRAAYVRCYMEYVPRDGRIFRGGYYRGEEGFLVRECRNVMPSWLFRESIWSSTLFPPKHGELSFEIYHRKSEAQLDSSRRRRDFPQQHSVNFYRRALWSYAHVNMMCGFASC